MTRFRTVISLLALVVLAAPVSAQGVEPSTQATSAGAAVAASAPTTATAPATATQPVATTMPALGPEDLVRKAGYQLAPASVATLLGVLAAGGDDDRARALIAQLGGNSPQVREQATQTLIHLPIVPERLLREAMKSKDIEVAVRAGRIYNNVKGLRPPVAVEQILALVAGREIKGLTASILDERLYPTLTWRRALVATATPADEQFLRRALAAKDAARQDAIQEALYAAMGDNALPELAAACKGKNTAQKLLAARVLAERGSRDALAPLAELLDSVELEHRVKAHQLLTALTGQKIDFEPTGAKQSSGLQAWQDWIANSAAAHLVHPLPPVEVPRFKLLAAVSVNGRGSDDPGVHEVWSIGADGKPTVLAKDIGHPFAVAPAGDGNILVADRDNKRIVKITPFGKIVMEIADLPAGPVQVVELPGGNILAALGEGKKAVEYDLKGQVRWEASFDAEVTDARRLPNGNTLLAMRTADPRYGYGWRGRLIEVDISGKEVFSPSYPFYDVQTAQRIADGHTLVVQPRQQTVWEFDARGETVWSFQQVGIQDAVRRADGNTVVVTPTRIFIVNEKGVSVQDIEGKGFCRIWAE